MRQEHIAEMDDRDRLASLVSAVQSGDEVHRLLDLIDSVLDPGPKGHGFVDILGIVRQGRHSQAFVALALHVNRLGRELAHARTAIGRAPLVAALSGLRERLRAVPVAPATSDSNVIDLGTLASSFEEAIVKVYEMTVWRTPAQAEVETWVEHLRNGLPFHEFLLLMSNSPEAKAGVDDTRGLEASDGHFIQWAFEFTQGRGGAGSEINHWLQKIERGVTTRAGVLTSLFISALRWAKDQEDAPPNDGLSCRIMGTQRDLSADQWQRQAREMAEGQVRAAPPDKDRYRHRFHVRGEPRRLVSALTSLYRGGEFIEQFMDNITSQDGFDDYCELVIVDADSPENESETIRRYLARHKNIKYIRMNYRIGIYDAWNVAAQAARGEYLTNANLDDLRRRDSFLLQAGALDNLPFVDVVYQDLYYTFDPRLSFEEIAAFGHQTNLPVVTLDNLVEYNSPHNAPMWRKRLHEEIGHFDTHFRSAGDYEFWFRCLAAGKVFYKINDPHVAYYQNPNGLSTRPDSRGVIEAMEVHRRYCRKLVPDEGLVSTDEFIGMLSPSDAGLLRRSGRFRYQIAHDALRNLARKRKFGERK